MGTAWAAILPRATWVEGTRFARLAPILHFINPGDFHLKEVCHIFSRSRQLLISLQHVVASLVASTAAGGSSAVMNFAVQRVSAYKIDRLYTQSKSASSITIQTSMQLPQSLPRSLPLVSGKLIFSPPKGFSVNRPDRYGLVGLLRPLTVYPSEMVYWAVCSHLCTSVCKLPDTPTQQNLPTVSIFQGMKIKLN